MRSSSSGFLLLLVGILAAIGFLTGNLDRWLGFLFQPPGSALPVGNTTGVAPGASATPVGPPIGQVAPGAGGSGVVAVAGTNARATA